MPEESLRKAVLCAAETVPRLEAELANCGAINKITIDSLKSILAQQDEELQSFRSGPGVMTVAGYILSGAAIGAAIAAAAMASK